MPKKPAKAVKKKFSQPLFTLSCKSMGGDDCGFSVITHSHDEAKKALWAHARYAHPEKMEAMPDAQKQMMTRMMDDLLTKQK